MSNDKKKPEQKADDSGLEGDFFDGAIDEGDFADRHDHSPTAPSGNDDAEAFDPDAQFPANSKDIVKPTPKATPAVTPAGVTEPEAPRRRAAAKPADAPADSEKALEVYREKVAKLPKEFDGSPEHMGLRGVNPERVILEHCEPVLHELVKSDLERRADYERMMRKFDEAMAEMKEMRREFSEGSAAFRATGEQMAKATAALGKQTAEQFKSIRQDTNANRVTNDQNNMRLSALVSATEGIHRGVEDLTKKKIKELLEKMENAMSAFLGKSTAEAVFKYGFAAGTLLVGGVFGACIYHWGYAG